MKLKALVSGTGTYASIRCNILEGVQSLLDYIFTVYNLVSSEKNVFSTSTQIAGVANMH